MSAEIVGYLASVLVALSLMMSNHFKLRVINFIGAAIFTVYGALLSPPAFPIIVVNSLIALTNLYFLYTMSRRKKFFRILHIVTKGSFTDHFMKVYAEDIKKFFPKFDWEKERKRDTRCLFLMRDANPTGLFIYDIRRKSVVIILDYVIPEYRDMKNSDYLFMVMSERFLDEGMTEYVVEDVFNVEHCKYLRTLGFKRDCSRPELMCRPL